MKVAYINGIILNGSEDMRPQKGMMILTEGEKIESVVPQTAKAPDGISAGRPKRQIHNAGPYKYALAPSGQRQT